MASIGRYRKIETRIWNDAKFHGLDDNGKLAFFLVLTHPHMTALGAMRSTMGGLADELKWTPEAMRDAITHAMSLGLVEMDERACYIGLPNFLRYNEPEGPNSVVKAWPQALELIPECPYKAKLIARCRSYLETRSKEFKDAMGDAIWDTFAMPCHIQEQEQEQELKQDMEQESKKIDHTARKARSRSRVATRIPEEFMVTEEHRVFAQKHNLPDPELAIEHFKDYWRAKPGKDSLKLDWDATFRNWLRNAVQFNGAGKQNVINGNSNRAAIREQQNKSAIAAGVEAAADEIFKRKNELGSQSIPASAANAGVGKEPISRVV